MKTAGEILEEAQGKKIEIDEVAKKINVKEEELWRLRSKHSHLRHQLTKILNQPRQGELYEEVVDYDNCKFCDEEYPLPDMHLHQGQFVGPCCWDERLRVTE